MFVTWVSKKSWKTSLSEFTPALEIHSCLRKNFCNTCELIDVSDDILNSGGNVEDIYGYGFTWSFLKKPLLL